MACVRRLYFADQLAIFTTVTHPLMRNKLDPSVADGYKSNSQIARRVTENWFSESMYCPSCPKESVHQTRSSTKVVDFECSGCGAEFQLKSKQGTLGRNLRDAAYAPMMERVSAGLAPHFAFMTYRKQPWEIVDLLLVPRHFLTPAAIIAAPPLSPGARRAVAGLAAASSLTKFRSTAAFLLFSTAPYLIPTMSANFGGSSRGWRE